MKKDNILFRYFRIFIKLLLLFFSDWHIKLGSILFSVFLYINLQNSKILVKTVDIPVEYPKLTGNLFYSKQLDKTVKVKVEGFKDLVNYHIQFMKVVIDANEIQAGENTVEVKKIWGNSSRIKVTPLTGKISFYIEQGTVRSIPVEVIFEDDLPVNVIRTSHFIKPSTVTLSGPKSIVEKIPKYTVGTVSLKDARESFTKSLKPVELPKGVSLSGGVREFQLRVNIAKGATDAGDQIVRGIPIKCDGLDSNLSADLSHDEVSVKLHSGTPLNSIQIFQGLKAYVPCNYTFDSKTKRILPSSLPALIKVRVLKGSGLKNIDILSVIPDKITVSYSVKPEALGKPNSSDKKEIGTFPEPPLEEPKLP